MLPDLKHVEEAILRLPVAERAALAERLIQSLDTLDDTENERLWVEEAERRYAAYKAGTVSARVAADALADVYARLRR